MTKRSQYLEANHRAVFFMTYGDFPHPCFFCGEQVDGYLIPRDDRSAVIHHVAHDHQNNDPENLVPGHQKCHTDYHRTSPETQARQRASQRLRIEREGPRSHTDEARAKMSAAKMGHVVTAEQRAKQAATVRGRKMSDETRAKMSAASAGKPKSASHRANIAAARRGKPSPFQGRHSPESIEKMRQAALARPKQPQACCVKCRRAMTVAVLPTHSCRPKVRKPRTRLSPEQQAEVYAKYEAGEANQPALAVQYGVSQPYVSTIIRYFKEGAAPS